MKSVTSSASGVIPPDMCNAIMMIYILTGNTDGGVEVNVEVSERMSE